MFEMIGFFFETYSLPTAISVIIAYLLGSINFSIIVTHIFIKKDIRDFGSGNAGATNVLRSVGKIPALITFVGDFLKQVASIWIARALFVTFALRNEIVVADTAMRYAVYLAGVSCFIGHIYPIYFGFRGGKGVITVAAMMALIDWRVFLIELAIFAILFAWKKIVSLCSIVCGACYPLVTFFIAYFIDYHGYVLGTNESRSMYYVIVATCITAFVGAIVVFKHRSNIVRLIKGTEKPIIAKKEKKA